MARKYFKNIEANANQQIDPTQQNLLHQRHTMLVKNTNWIKIQLNFPTSTRNNLRWIWVTYLPIPINHTI